VWFIRSPSTFLWNELFHFQPSSEPEVNRRQALVTALRLDSEDGDYMFLRNFYGVYQTVRRYVVVTSLRTSYPTKDVALFGRQKKEREKE
jgi:hypothetical protein